MIKIKSVLSPALSIAIMFGLFPVQHAFARRDDQGELRKDVQQGKVKSPREVEAIVVPRMRGMQYLGPEYDPAAQVYRLKFIDKDRVIFVDVDAKTGTIIRQR